MAFQFIIAWPCKVRVTCRAAANSNVKQMQIIEKRKKLGRHWALLLVENYWYIVIWSVLRNRHFRVIKRSLKQQNGDAVISDTLIFRPTLFCLLDPLATSAHSIIPLSVVCLSWLIILFRLWQQVWKMKIQMRTRAGLEMGKERGREKGWEGGPIILLFNPLKVEAHQSESPWSNDSCSAFIKV